MDEIVWQPRQPETTRMVEFMQFIEKKYCIACSDYEALHRWSIQSIPLFWESLCEYFALDFDTPPEQILNEYQHMLDAHWFANARFNFAAQLLARQDNHPALIAHNENGQRDVLSYAVLKQEVSRCAQALKNLGVKSGDRVVAILPNVPYAVIAMLASASLGAIWSCCSPDFGAQAVIDRFSQLEPKVLFATNGHQYLGKQHDATLKLLEIYQSLPSLQKLIVCPVLEHEMNLTLFRGAALWNDFVKESTLECTFDPFPFEHPLYIVFSSGTTGKPKCIVHGAGGTLLQHMKELGLHTDLRANDTLFFYTTCGWMMWNWMISALALGVTLILYEGSPAYPDSYRLFQLIEEENIHVFGTSAKFISSLMHANIIPKQRVPLTNLRTILSTGSPLLPQHYDFVYEKIKTNVQLSSISGGTDIISCFALGNPILPVYRGELQCLGLGMDVHVVNNKGIAVVKEQGELVCRQPFPSMPLYFWKDKGKKLYQKSYFSRFDTVWAQGDFAAMTRHKGLIIYGRSDTVLNPGGVRIGTAEIYRHVEKIPMVLESVAIGQEWQDDVRIVLFVVLQEGLVLDATLIHLIAKTIKENASPRHVPAKILQVKDIPRTMNGKIAEIAVRKAVHHQPIDNVDSLMNPEALNDFKEREELLS